MTHISAKVILRGLQVQGEAEVPFRRHLWPIPGQRGEFLSLRSSKGRTDVMDSAAEKQLSPFYTFLPGPEPITPISDFPTGKATSWRNCPSICLDAADLINERAGRMWPHQRE